MKTGDVRAQILAEYDSRVVRIIRAWWTAKRMEQYWSIEFKKADEKWKRLQKDYDSLLADYRRILSDNYDLRRDKEWYVARLKSEEEASQRMVDSLFLNELRRTSLEAELLRANRRILAMLVQLLWYERRFQDAKYAE